jgi:hypothetical protein
MSWKATAYVKELTVAPNGARITPAEKLLLFVLADYHHTNKDIIWPSQATLAEEALTTERNIRRLVDSLVDKGLLEVQTFAGRGATAAYRFTANLTETKGNQPAQEKEDGLSPFPSEETGRKADIGDAKSGRKEDNSDTAIRKNREPVSTTGNSKPCDQASPESPGQELTLHGKIEKTIKALHEKKYKLLPSWDGSEARALAEMIKANPSWTWEDWRRLILNRFQSQTDAERPRLWIRHIGKYAAGPLDRFSQPLTNTPPTRGQPSKYVEVESESPAAIAQRQRGLT